MSLERTAKAHRSSSARITASSLIAVIARHLMSGRCPAEEPLSRACILEEDRNFGHFVTRVERQENNKSSHQDRPMALSTNPDDCCHVGLAEQPVLPLEGVV